MSVSPARFCVRSVDPPLQHIEGRRVVGLRRLGKRIVWELDDGLFVVIHLMIAGRFRWTPAATGTPPAIPGKVGLAAFDFSTGSLILTEASRKKRASLYVVSGEGALATHDRGGLEVLRG